MINLLLRVWKLVFSPLIGERCRFYPSCSEYAAEAVTKHGVFKGSGLAVWRILRCNPLFSGGVDPVPEKQLPSAKVKAAPGCKNKAAHS